MWVRFVLDASMACQRVRSPFHDQTNGVIFIDIDSNAVRMKARPSHSIERSEIGITHLEMGEFHLLRNLRIDI